MSVLSPSRVDARYNSGTWKALRARAPKGPLQKTEADLLKTFRMRDEDEDWDGRGDGKVILADGETVDVINKNDLFGHYGGYEREHAALVKLLKREYLRIMETQDIALRRAWAVKHKADLPRSVYYLTRGPAFREGK